MVEGGGIDGFWVRLSSIYSPLNHPTMADIPDELPQPVSSQ